MLIQKYQHLLLTIFLFTLVVLMNLQISRKNKLILLLVCLIVCIYNPKFLLPLFTSLIVIYLFNKKFRNSETTPNTIETFAEIDDFKKLLAKVDDDNITTILTKTVMDKLKKDLKDEKIKFEAQDKELFERTSFLKDIHKTYFFKFPEDIPLHLDLNLKYPNYKNLQKQFKFSSTSHSEEGRDNMEELLNDKTLKKLGLMVYKSNSLNIKKFFLSTIQEYGLYTIYNNSFDLETVELDVVQKKIYEIAILIYYFTHREKPKGGKDPAIEFNFNTKRDLKELPLINIIPEFIKNQNLVASKRDPKFKILIDLLLGLNTELKEIDGVKKTLFPKKIDLTAKYTEGANKGNLVYDIDKLSECLDKIFKEIEEHFENLELIDINLYRMTNSKQRKTQELTIKNNYFILLFITGYFDDILKAINTKKDAKGAKTLETNLIKLHSTKKKIFDLQIKNELKIDQKYNFTSADDLFYEKLFYFYGLRYDISAKLPLIFIYKKAERKETEEEKKDSVNPLSAYQQKNFELELDDFLTPEKLQEKQEEALQQYYKFLDKDNYEKIKSLNKLAEERNKELKIKTLSFDRVIDDFGKEVFKIIDEIGLVLYKFYRDDDLVELKSKLAGSWDNPSFIEEFADSKKKEETKKNPELTRFEKYILLVRIILDILLKRNRIMYVGFIFIILALFIYFIDAGEGYSSSPAKPKINSIFDILRL